MRRMIQHSAPARDYESVSVGASAVGVDATKRAASTGVFITVENQNIRYRMDGTDPTASEGHLVYVGNSLYLLHPTAIENLRMIAETGTATIRVSFY